MPWSCGPCGHEVPDDVLRCPTCGLAKTSWTMQPASTRTFSVAARALQCLRAAPARDGALVVTLDVDPDDPGAADDRFVLFSRDGDFAAREMSIADDRTRGDGVVTLELDGLDRRLRYSLEVRPGAAGAPYRVFDDVPFQELAGGRGAAAPAVTWEPATSAPVSAKATIRTLLRRGATVGVDRLLLVRNTRGRALRLTLHLAARPTVDLELPPGEDERRLLLVFGREATDDLVGPGLDGAEVVDVGDDGDDGAPGARWAPRLELSAGGRRPLELELEGPGAGRLTVRLAVDPDASASADDRFVLSSRDGRFSPQELLPADDLTPGDAAVDLLFVGLDEEARYTLTVDPGAEGAPYAVFEDVPYAALRGSGGGPAAAEEAP